MTTRRLELLRAVKAGKVYRWLFNLDVVRWSLPNGTSRTVTDRAETLVEAGLIELGTKPTQQNEKWKYGLTAAGDATIVNWTALGPEANPSRRIEDQPGEVFADPRDNIVAAVLDLLASVSRETLARRADPARGIELLHTRVGAHQLRRLADLVEEALPGAIDEVRDAGRGE